MTDFWQSLGRIARASLIAGMALILITTALIAFWLLRSDYQVLFSDLKPQDTAAMTAELEKLKVPYRVDDAGTTILVDKPQVHPTRIKLMGKDLPLHGAVGFELFNNTDFGMTEFAQKVNYQRALQGELTRTILSLSEIRDVRVHLALPEQGLFKQATSKPKAAITLTMREGQHLRQEQVSGIQRLVAAATPGMTANDVTVVDKQGVALSRLNEDTIEGSSGAFGSGNVRLELKKETEAQLARKATAVLDKAFGPGQTLVSVDVTLNMDQTKTTTEDVIPAASRNADSKGVMVKERESVRDGNVPPLDTTRHSGGIGSSTQREVDYQVGRRVEQVTSLAGAVRRIQVVAVVRQPLDSTQEEQLRRLLAAAVGASTDRGDAIVVQSLSAWATVDSQGLPTAVGGSDNNQIQSMKPAPLGKPEIFPINATVLLISCSGGLVVCILLYLSLQRWRDREAATYRSGKASLSESDKQKALLQVQEWMKGSVPPNGVSRTTGTSA